MVGAFGEQLTTIDELRTHMPDPRAREINLCNQIHVLDSQLAAARPTSRLLPTSKGSSTGIMTRRRVSTAAERRHVLRLLVEHVLVGPRRAGNEHVDVAIAVSAVAAADHHPSPYPHPGTHPQRGRRHRHRR